VNRDRFATISPSRIGRTCHSLIGIMKSKHSRRMVPITRSQKAFACGARTGVFRVPRPIASSVRSTRLQPSVSRPRTSLRLGALAHPAGPGGPPHLLRWAQRMAAPNERRKQSGESGRRPAIPQGHPGGADPTGSHMSVVSIGNGPSAARITSRRPRTNSTIS
jgi:hypothetical protein